MKKIMLIAAVALLAMGCNQTYTVKGTLTNYSGPVELVSPMDTIISYGSTTTAEDGSFSIEVKSKTQLFAQLQYGEKSLPIFLDGELIEVETIALGDGEYSAIAKGTPANDGHAAYTNELTGLLAGLSEEKAEEMSEEDIFNIFIQLQEIANNAFEKNKYNLFGAYFFVNSAPQMEPAQALAELANYPKEIQNVPEIKELKKQIEEREANSLKKALPIELKDKDGNTVTLDEVLSKNEYVLLDFWASWCNPCMGEIPYLVEDYAAYKAKGFEIFGVSIDQSSEEWMRAMEENGMVWVNVIDAEGAVAQAYGVESIPTNYLLDKKGKIVAKNLRGEAVAEKLAELLGAAE